MVGLLLCLLWTAPRAQAQTVSSTRIHTELKQILGQSEFRINNRDDGAFQAISKRLETVWNSVTKVWDRFWNWVRDLFHIHGGGAVVGGVGRTLVFLFIAVFLLGAAWMIAWVVRRFLDASHTSKGARTASIAVDEDQEERLTEPDEWMRQAQHHAMRQDYRRALRALFMSGLMRLDRAGLIHYERSRTNGDYLRTLRSAGRSTIHAALLPFSTEFERHWYGQQETTEADYRHGMAAVETLSGLMRQTPPPPSSSPPRPPNLGGLKGGEGQGRDGAAGADAVKPRRR